MALQLQCPGCGTVCRISESMRGSAVRCKKCQQVFRIASPKSAPAARTAEDADVLEPTPASKFKIPLLIAGGGLAALLLIAGSFIVGKSMSSRAQERVEAQAAEEADSRKESPTREGAADPAEPAGAEPQPAGSAPGGGDGGPLAGIPGQALAEESLQALKNATVFVKVTKGTSTTTGAGFVVRVEGDDAFVVTTRHSVMGLPQPPPRGGFTGAIETPTPLPPAPSIEVVFYSGTNQEQAAQAELMAQDPRLDLAILKARSANGLAAPDLNQNVSVREGRPLFVLGYPFGKGQAPDQGNPPVILSPASVGRPHQPDFHLLHIGIGGKNPGLGGGPVFDGQGRLAGVANENNPYEVVAPAEVTRMLRGWMESVTFVTKTVDPTHAEVTAEIEFTDPLRRVRNIGLYYVIGSAIDQVQIRDGRVPVMPGAEKMECTIEGLKAKGSKVMTCARAGRASFKYQLTYLDTDGVQRLSVSTPYESLAPGMRVAMVPKGQLPVLTTPPTSSAKTVPTITSEGQPLYAEGTVGQVSFKQLGTKLQVPLGCLTWSRDGKAFFCLDGMGMVRRIGLDSLQEDAHLDIGQNCSWLTTSAVGVIVTVNSNQAWVLDEKKLKRLAIIPIPNGTDRVVSAPALAIAVACSTRGGLSLIDLRTGRIPRQVGGLQGGAGVRHAVFAPDGKHLFAEGSNGQLVRYRFEGTLLLPEQSSRPIAHDAERIDISPDGKYISLPCANGNGTGSYITHIYATNDLSNPVLKLAAGAFPRAIGFDPAAGLIYGQNTHCPLIVFSSKGTMLQEVKLDAASEVKQILVHLRGRKVLLLMASGDLYAVDVPSA